MHVRIHLISGIIIVALPLPYSSLSVQESEQGSERPGGQAVAHYQHLHAPQNTRVRQETGLKATRKTKGCFLHVCTCTCTYMCVYMEIHVHSTLTWLYALPLNFCEQTTSGLHPPSRCEQVLSRMCNYVLVNFDSRPRIICFPLSLSPTCSGGLLH